MQRIRPLVLLAVLSGAACADPCANSVVRDLVSPDGSRHAVLFTRDCGATTGFSSHVSILSSDRLPDGSGNSLVVDGDGASPPDWPGRGPAVEVRWTGPRSLEIRHDAVVNVYKKESRIDDVEVRYLVDSTQPPRPDV